MTPPDNPRLDTFPFDTDDEGNYRYNAYGSWRCRICDEFLNDDNRSWEDSGLCCDCYQEDDDGAEEQF
jgi:hypothetical protein